MPTFVIEDHMLDWHTCQICYPLEIKLLLLLLSAQSDQSLCWALYGSLRMQHFMRAAKTLIRRGRCPGWSEFLLGAQVILLFFAMFLLIHKGVLTGSPRLALQWDTRAKWSIRAAFSSGTGLRSRNSQTFLFRETKYGWQIVRTRTVAYMVLGGKIFSNVHSNQDFPGTGDHG